MSAAEVHRRGVGAADKQVDAFVGASAGHNLIFGADNLAPEVLAPAAFDGATPLDIARAKGNQAAVSY